MEFIGCVELDSQYTPLPWLYKAGHDLEVARRSGIHTGVAVRPIPNTPPPAYGEVLRQDQLPRMAYHHISDHPLTYAKVRRSSSKILVLDDDDGPWTPIRSASLSSNASTVSTPSSEHSFASDISTSTTSSSASSRTLRRRSRQWPRGLSLRQIRAKESEAELRRVYSTTVDAYLSGEIFDNFRSWPEPVLEES